MACALVKGSAKHNISCSRLYTVNEEDGKLKEHSYARPATNFHIQNPSCASHSNDIQEAF